MKSQYSLIPQICQHQPQPRLQGQTPVVIISLSISLPFILRPRPLSLGRCSLGRRDRLYRDILQDFVTRTGIIFNREFVCGSIVYPADRVLVQVAAWTEKFGQLRIMVGCVIEPLAMVRVCSIISRCGRRPGSTEQRMTAYSHSARPSGAVGGIPPFQTGPSLAQSQKKAYNGRNKQ